MLSQANLTAVLSWQLSASNPFGTVGTGIASEDFSLAGLVVGTWNQLYAAQFVVFVTAPASPAAQLAAGGTLTVGTTYYYKITGTGPYGPGTTTESGPSSEVSATPTTGNQSITLTWTQLQGATGYKIYRGTSAGSENKLVGTITSGSTVTFTDTGFTGSSASPPAMPNSYVEFDISSFTNLVGETVTTGHVLSLMITPTGTGATCVLSPGASNGLTWFFGGTSPTLTIPIGGVEVHSDSPTGPGTVVDSTHKTLRITNGGSANLTASVVIVLSTT